MEEQVALRNSLHNEKQEDKTRKDRELFTFSVLFISDKIYAICLLAKTPAGHIASKIYRTLSVYSKSHEGFISLRSALKDTTQL